MKKSLIAIVIVIIVAVGIYYVASNSGQLNTAPVVPTDNSVATTPATASPQPVINTSADVSAGTVVAPVPASAPVAITIHIKGFAFNPATLTIKKGTKITWINDDSAPHTVTSDSGTVLNSPTLSQGQSFSFTFTDAGTYSYHCTVHPMMKAQITVQG